MPLRVPTSGIVLVSCLSGKGCVGHCDAVDVMRLELKQLLPRGALAAPPLVNPKWQLSMPFIAIYRKIFTLFFAAVPHILPTYPSFPTKL